MKKPSIKELLSEDNEFAKFKRIVINLKTKMDLEEMRKETYSLHETRLNKTLSVTNPSPARLGRIMAQENTARSRLTKIRVELTNAVGLLDRAVKDTRVYIFNRYADDLPSFRSREDRLTYINRYLKNGATMAAEMDNLIIQVDLIIKDIDQCYWQVRGVSEMLVLQYGKNAGEKNL